MGGLALSGDEFGDESAMSLALPLDARRRIWRRLIDECGDELAMKLALPGAARR